MFTNRDLKNLILPLFVEQFLLMFVGIADTFVVSFSSEADVSGVSLVTSFNTVLIFLFTALSSGGAVIISQYIGNEDEKSASRSSGQLLMISVVISVMITSLILSFHTQLLKLLFGRIEADVMKACESYLLITTLSLPFLAVYDTGAALCRSIRKTNATMFISIVANVINVIGNCAGVFALHLGAAGVAYPSLISRILSAVAITFYCFKKQNPIRYKLPDILEFYIAVCAKATRTTSGKITRIKDISNKLISTGRITRSRIKVFIRHRIFIHLKMLTVSSAAAHTGAVRFIEFSVIRSVIACKKALLHAFYRKIQAPILAIHRNIAVAA